MGKPDTDADTDSLKTAIQTLPGRTKAARLRKLMPEINQQVIDGIQHQEIVDALNSQGFDINLNTFRSYLYRYRKQVNEVGGDQKQTLSSSNDFESETGGNQPETKRDDLDTNPEMEKPEPDQEKSQDENISLDDVLNARKRDKIGDDYTSRKRPLRRNR